MLASIGKPNAFISPNFFLLAQEYLQLLKNIYKEQMEYSLVTKIIDETYSHTSATYFMVEFSDAGMSEQMRKDYPDLVKEKDNIFIVQYNKAVSLDKILFNLKLCFGKDNLFSTQEVKLKKSEGLKVNIVAVKPLLTEHLKNHSIDFTHHFDT